MNKTLQHRNLTEGQFAIMVLQLRAKLHGQF